MSHDPLCERPNGPNYALCYCDLIAHVREDERSLVAVEQTTLAELNAEYRKGVAAARDAVAALIHSSLCDCESCFWMKPALAAIDGLTTNGGTTTDDGNVTEPVTLGSRCDEQNTLEHTDIVLNTHRASDCMGHYCTIHNRSDHSMRSFPQWWRNDRGIMERICPHGIGHPDPDDYKVMLSKAEQIHGCDGCCGSANADIPVEVGERRQHDSSDTGTEVPGSGYSDTPPSSGKPNTRNGEPAVHGYDGQWERNLYGPHLDPCDCDVCCRAAQGVSNIETSGYAPMTHHDLCPIGKTMAEGIALQGRHVDPFNWVCACDRLAAEYQRGRDDRSAEWQDVLASAVNRAREGGGP